MLDNLRYRKDKRVDRAENSVEDGLKLSVRTGWLWRGMNLLMFSFFTMAAYVQINDPDPWLWIPVYGVPALLTAAVAIRPALQAHHIWSAACRWHSLACWIFIVYVFVQFWRIMVIDLPAINPLLYEEGRELMGLIIVQVWLFSCRKYAFSSDDECQAESSKLFAFTVIFSVFPLLLWAFCSLDEMKSYIGMCKGMLMD